MCTHALKCACFRNHCGWRACGCHSHTSFSITLTLSTVVFASARVSNCLWEWHLQAHSHMLLLLSEMIPGKKKITLSRDLIQQRRWESQLHYSVVTVRMEPCTYEGVWIILQVNMRAIDFDCTHNYRRTPINGGNINTSTLSTSYHLHNICVIQQW